MNRNQTPQIKNISQVNALTTGIAEKYGIFQQTVVNVLRYLNGSGLVSALSMKREDVITALETGSIPINKDSKKTKTKTIKISHELDMALRKAVKLSVGKKYLFSASLTGSNRASEDKPITRQSVQRWFSSVRADVAKASRNSGVTDLRVITPLSLLNFNQGSEAFSETIFRLITTFGEELTESALEELHKNLEKSKTLI
ncbi:MAG: hypothetical protein ACJAS1_002648 [Oleiphilaceae bacterium]|jgi:hypothetical protein